MPLALCVAPATAASDFRAYGPLNMGKRRVLALLDRLAGKPAYAAECVAFDTAKLIGPISRDQDLN
jgi:hypothetical protein